MKNSLLNVLKKIYKNEKLFRIFDMTNFVLLLANIVCWPLFTYLDSFLIITNLLEYCFLFLFLVSIPFYNERLVKIKKIFLLLTIFVFYIVLSNIVQNNLNSSTFYYIFKQVYCLVLLFSLLVIISSEKRIKIVAIVFIISTYSLFLYTFATTPLSLLKEAFLGGKYRLGNNENQANAYGCFCIISGTLPIILMMLTKNKSYLFLSVVPFLMAVGTQSKKALLSLIVVIIYGIILFCKLIRRKSLKAVIGCLFISIFITSSLFLVKIGALSRLFGNSGAESTFERISMYKIAFLDNGRLFLFGHGANSFIGLFFLNYGNSVIFHSMLGDCFYSYGFIGLFFWILLVIKLLFPKRNIQHASFFYLILVVQFIFDVSAQVWAFLPQTLFLAVIFELKNIISNKQQNINITI